MLTNRVILFYTDSRLDERLAGPVRDVLNVARGDIPIISISQKPLDFGEENICIGEHEPSYPQMYRQILVGLRAVPRGTMVNMCEHDVFYHPSHFEYVPADRRRAHFNRNRYYYHRDCDTFLLSRGKNCFSQGVGDRKPWIDHVKKRLTNWKPMQIARRNFHSEFPNVDVRHTQNFTNHGPLKNPWIRGRKKGVESIPGWGTVQNFRQTVGYDA
jgi:hypothetical protein